MKYIFTCIILLLASSCQNVKPDSRALKPTIILLSLDGFHPSYLERYTEGFFADIEKEGVRAQWMTPVFPSKTYPNHYAIATGLYSENHGIVHNTMYDSVYKQIFRLSNRSEVQNPRWWQGEPIWVTAEKNGLRSTSFFFPGTETKISGIIPGLWKAYDGSVPNSVRVDSVLSWLDLPEEQRPQICTLYFSDLDDIGHAFSPRSSQVDAAIQEVDRDIGRLVEGLKKRNLYDQVNLIIVSDHGMAEVKAHQYVILDDYFDVQNADTIIWDKQISGIFPKPGKENHMYQELKKNNPEHVQIWRKKDIPDRFHYRNNRRIPPILILADEGWLISKRSIYEKLKNAGSLPGKNSGAHGYDNQLPSMRAIFLARGPAFKKGLTIAPFENIHLYNMMSRILNIPPADNDGEMELADTILKE